MKIDRYYLFPYNNAKYVKIVIAIPGNHNHNNSGTMSTELYAKDHGSGPLRGTAGREFFEFLVTDPPRGRPVGGGGIHRDLWREGNNHLIMHPDLTTAPINAVHYCSRNVPCICTGCRER